MKPRFLLAPLAAFALLTACDDSSVSPVQDTSRPGVFVLGQKYGANGGSSLQKIQDGGIVEATPEGGMPTHSNTRIDMAAGTLFLFDGNEGTVTGFGAGDVRNPVLDENLGSSSNPYGVAKVGDIHWFALYGSARLRGISATGAATKEIDLSKYNEATAAVPHVMDVVAWNDRIVAVLQRLDKSFQPSDSSLVLVIDPSDGSVSRRVALPFLNPYDIDLRGSMLALGCTGGWGSNTDGGLAIVDLSSGKVTNSVKASSIGGDPASVAFVSDDRVWVGADMGYPVSRAIPVDLATGKVGTPYADADAVLDIAWDGASLWVANHDDKAPHVHEIDASTAARRNRYTASLAPGFLKVVK